MAWRRRFFASRWLRRRRRC